MIYQKFVLQEVEMWSSFVIKQAEYELNFVASNYLFRI